MGWGVLLSAFASVPDLARRNDDDFFDRLNYKWTAAQLICFAVLVTTKTYVREDPISCWAPAHFSKSWEKYTNSYCWVSNTYYLPFDENVAHDPRVRGTTNPIVYYQWVPMILLVQALLFYLPIVVWRGLSDRTGIDIHAIVETAEKFQSSELGDSKEKLLRYLTKHLSRYLELSRKPPRYRGCCRQDGCRPNWRWIISRLCCGWFCCGQRSGNYMLTVYFFTKVLFVINAIGQLFLLNWFLGHKFSFYGVFVIRAMINKEDWTESPHFPRVTMCEVDIRRLGNLHRYTLQCVLPINLFNEKIYLYVWFLFVFVAGVTILGLILWCFRFAIPSVKYRYVRDNLVLAEGFDAARPKDQRAVGRFVSEYLRADGVLVLRLVDLNTNKMTLREVLAKLWENFRCVPVMKNSLQEEESDEESV